GVYSAQPKGRPDASRDHMPDYDNRGTVNDCRKSVNKDIKKLHKYVLYLLRPICEIRLRSKRVKKTKGKSHE
ncbi:hypothetical protein, partial [Mesorhizobium sp.]|uniref:hypothetical protein n=1 Tax=Mesorhizobium sp. TaxID=1871066 RepID=UPI0025BC5E45